VFIITKEKDIIKMKSFTVEGKKITNISRVIKSKTLNYPNKFWYRFNIEGKKYRYIQEAKNIDDLKKIIKQHIKNNKFF